MNEFTVFSVFTLMIATLLQGCKEINEKNIYICKKYLHKII